MKLFSGEDGEWDASGGGSVPEQFIPTFGDYVIFFIIMGAGAFFYVSVAYTFFNLIRFLAYKLFG